MATAAARRFNALIEPHLEAVYRAAFRMVRNKADAEDLVQETCIRAIQQLANLNESKSVKSWLLSVMHNLFVDGARRAQRSPIISGHDKEHVESASPSANPEELAIIMQREERLHDAWARLDRSQQILLALRAEEYSTTEIAQITGIPIDALYARLYRARLKLAEHLNDKPLAKLEDRMEIAK